MMNRIKHMSVSAKHLCKAFQPWRELVLFFCRTYKLLPVWYKMHTVYLACNFIGEPWYSDTSRQIERYGRKSPLALMYLVDL